MRHAAGARVRLGSRASVRDRWTAAGGMSVHRLGPRRLVRRAYAARDSHWWCWHPACAYDAVRRKASGRGDAGAVRPWASGCMFPVRPWASGCMFRIASDGTRNGRPV